MAGVSKDIIKEGLTKSFILKGANPFPAS